MWYFGIELFGESELYTSTVNAYQRFARNPTESELAALQVTLRIMSNSVPERLRPFYQMASLGADTFRALHNLEDHRGSSELQFTTVLQCVAHWRNLLDDDFVVFHDESSNFFRASEVWERVTNAHVPEQIHAGTNAAPHKYPLRVLSTSAIDSKSSFSIQLCDLIAGLTTRQLRSDHSPEDRAFLDEVLKAGFEKLSVGGIKPEPILTEGGPSKLTGPDAVDRLMSIMFPRSTQTL
jgi:hypothetical protein